MTDDQRFGRWIAGAWRDDWPDVDQLDDFTPTPEDR